MTILLAASFDDHERAAWTAALQTALPGEHFVTTGTDGPAEGIDIAIVANPPDGALRGVPKLKLIQSLWAGVDKLMADDSVPRDVPIARMVDPAMNAAMAETALWAVLSLHRGYFRYAALQHEARWSPHGQQRADEITVAVLGLGEMGRAAARRLVAQGYRVLGWSTRPAQIDGVSAHAGEAALNDVLAAADIVVNLLPLTPHTRDLFRAETFARMKPQVSLVNLARGAHVVETDLLAALDSGQLQHAVLDVFRTEPLPPDHPLWRHPRVTVLPHAAAQTDPRSAAAVAAANVRAARAGLPVAHLVDRTRGY